MPVTKQQAEFSYDMTRTFIQQQLCARVDQELLKFKRGSQVRISLRGLLDSIQRQDFLDDDMIAHVVRTYSAPDVAWKVERKSGDPYGLLTFS